MLLPRHVIATNVDMASASITGHARRKGSVRGSRSGVVQIRVRWWFQCHEAEGYGRARGRGDQRARSISQYGNCLATRDIARMARVNHARGVTLGGP